MQGQLRGEPGEESQLAWETFPYTGLIKTYNTDKQALLLLLLLLLSFYIYRHLYFQQTFWKGKFQLIPFE